MCDDEYVEVDNGYTGDNIMRSPTVASKHQMVFTDVHST